GKMACKNPGPIAKLRIGHRGLRVAIGDLGSPRHGVPPKQFGDGRNQIRVQHRISVRIIMVSFQPCLNSPQTMLKPPLMLSTWPVIHPLRGEASIATIGATSLAKPSRRRG